MSIAELIHNYFEPLDGKQGSCTLNEYVAIVATLYQRVPCNLLVFGAGQDSVGWNSLNEGGKTIFIEDQDKWIQHVESLCGSGKVIKVNYPSSSVRWRFNLIDVKEGNVSSDLTLDLPPWLRSTPWDCIIVDGPMGEIYGGPGRQCSLIEASRLASKNCVLCVHDANRNLERLFCRQLFDCDRLFFDVERLRIYFGNQF